MQLDRKYVFILFYLLFFFTNPIWGQSDSIRILEQKLSAIEVGTATYFQVLDRLTLNNYLNANNDSADSLATILLAQAQKFKQAKFEARAFYLLGIVKPRLGEHKAAQQFFQQAFESYEHLGDYSAAFSCLKRESFVYYELIKYNKVLAIREKALSFCLEHQLKKELVDAYIALGDHFKWIGCRTELGIDVPIHKRKNISKSIINYEKAIERAKILKDSALIHKAQLEIIAAYYYAASDEKVIDLGLKLMEIEKKNVNQSWLCQLNLYVGGSYAELKQFDKANNFLEEGLAIAQTKNDFVQEEFAYVLLYDLNLIRKDYEKALKYYKEAKLADFEQYKNIQLEEMEIQLETEKKEKENLKLQQEKKTLRNQSFFIITLAIILVIGISIITFLFFRLRRQNTTIEQQKSVLKELDALKSRFFANMTHELRTPLTLILAPLRDILKKEKLDQPLSTRLKKVEGNAKKLLGLTDEILDLSKLEANKLELEEEKVVFHSFIQRLFAAFTSYAHYRSIEMQLDYRLSTTLQIELDTKKFEKVFNNLLSNALKFTPSKGTITVSAQDLGKSIQLEVMDTGSGIHPADLPHIFDRFYQADTTKKSLNAGGAGIGLALSFEYAKLMDGQLMAQNNTGLKKGSTFTFIFPKKEVFGVIAPNHVALENGFAQSDIVLPPNPGVKHHILVVEDNKEMLEYLQSILSENYRVTGADNGQTALQQLEKNNIDLILSDVMMPEMDGFQLLEQVKKHAKWQFKPFILLTARVEQEDKLRGLHLGVDDYLTKPFVSEELIVRVQNLLENYDARLSAQQQFRGNSTIDFEELPAADLVWLKQLETIVKTELANPDFTIKKLSNLLFLSERSLRDKIKLNTGLTPNQYLTEVRLQKARHLLENKSYATISEVSYAIGIQQPAYFTKLYKKRYNHLPSKYLKKA